MRHLAPALLTLAAGPASAHAFDTGADAYNQFLEGAGVMLGTPATLLALASLGLLAGIWRTDGMPRLWPMLLAGLALGIPAATAAGPWIVAPTLAAAVLSAALAAGAFAYPARILDPLALVTGLLAMMVALEGHGLGELPVMIHAGLIFGANFAAAVAAGAVVASRQTWPAGWLPLGWRIAASWTGAIALLLGAFALRG